MSARIEDYAMIGDCRTAAMVSRDGSVDWLCWPRFDSDACFAALLGEEKNGCWTLRPCSRVLETRRQYRGDHFILETGLTATGGRGRVIDFMPVGQVPNSLVRIV